VIFRKRFCAVCTGFVVLSCFLAGCSSNSSSEVKNTENGSASDSENNAITSDISAYDLAKGVIDANDFPAMENVTDNEEAKEFFKLDLESEKYSEISIWQCPMSAATAEIIVIKTKDVAGAKADLKARRDKLIKTDVSYPSDKEIAENSVIDSKGEYVWLIAVKDVNKAVATLFALLESN
jgi:hypothetical protein